IGGACCSEEEERQLREAALRQTCCRKTERDTGRNRERHREENREEPGETPGETRGETVETEPCCRTPAPGLTVRFSPTPLLSSAGETSSLSAANQSAAYLQPGEQAGARSRS
ncbi:hypothetical protein JOQ06_004025, partial [Pogonophryne albipinna]